LQRAELCTLTSSGAPAGMRVTVSDLRTHPACTRTQVHPLLLRRAPFGADSCNKSHGQQVPDPETTAWTERRKVLKFKDKISEN